MRYPILLLLTFLLCSCSEPLPVEREELIGTYVANHEQGEDRFELKEDGTYTHTFITLQGKSHILSDTWKYYQSIDYPIFTLNNFRHLWRDDIEPEEPSKNQQDEVGAWGPEVERTSKGKLSLYLDSDSGWYYYKMGKVAGTYVATHDKGQDILHIKENRTYTRKYIDMAGKSIEASGNWKYKISSPKVYINFDNFQPLGSAEPDQNNDGHWIAPLGKSEKSNKKTLGLRFYKHKFFVEM